MRFQVPFFDYIPKSIIRFWVASTQKRTSISHFPLTLDYRRLFIVPSAQGLFIIAMLLTVFLGALNYNNNPGLFFVTILFLYIAWGIIKTHHHMMGIVVTSFSILPGRADEGLPIILGLRNDSDQWRRGIRIRVSDLDFSDDDALMVIDIPPNQTVNVKWLWLPRSTTYRGQRMVPRFSVYTTQPLGLATCWTYIQPPESMIIWPAFKPLPDYRTKMADVKDDKEPTSTRYLLSEDGDLKEVREYRDGDAKRKIAWKISAKRDALMVKVLEMNTDEDDCVLDWSSSLFSEASYEDRISLFSSLITEMHAQGKKWIFRSPYAQEIRHDFPNAYEEAQKGLALMPKIV
jgi:uncharacterized protein (DUF58 family)